MTGFPPAAASGNGISLGTFVFHVETAGLAPRFDVTLQAAGNILYANNVEVDTEGNVIPTQYGIVDISTVSITPLPEPATSLVVAGGLLVAATAGRRTRYTRGLWSDGSGSSRYATPPRADQRKAPELRQATRGSRTPD